MKGAINQNRKYMKTNTILNTELIPLENDNEVIENSNQENSFQIRNRVSKIFSNN